MYKNAFLKLGSSEDIKPYATLFVKTEGEACSPAFSEQIRIKYSDITFQETVQENTDVIVYFGQDKYLTSGEKTAFVDFLSSVEKSRVKNIVLLGNPYLLYADTEMFQKVLKTKNVYLLSETNYLSFETVLEAFLNGSDMFGEPPILIP